jgi:hypothetical protein
MPMIKLPTDVLNATRPPENGWSKAQLVKTSENMASNKESMNYYFEFVCLDGPNGSKTNEGRSLNQMYNGKNLGMVPGYNAYQPRVEEFLSMIVALSGKSKLEVLAMEDGYDVDRLVGRTCWIKVSTKADQNGNQQSTIIDYSPDQIVPF